MPLWPYPSNSNEYGKTFDSSMITQSPLRHQVHHAEPLLCESLLADAVASSHPQQSTANSSCAPHPLGNNASGWEIPGVAARSLFNPHDAVRKPRSKDEGKFPPPSRNRQCLQEPDLLQESRRDGPSSQASLVSHAKGCSPVAREPPRGGQATPPTCRSYISPICSPSSSRCITSFGIGSAVKSKTSTGRHQLQGTRAVQSRAIHLAPTAGRALAAERRSFFVDGGVVQIPGELASPIVSKQHPGELPQNRFVPAHDEVGRQLRRKQPDIISSISGAFSLVHTSSIHASSRQRNLQPQIGAHSPKHSGKGAACFKTAPRQSGFGGSAAVVPMGTAAAGRLNASTVIHSPFISGAGTVLPTVLGAAHPPFFGLRSQQRQRGTAEVHGETPGHSMPHQPEVPAISLKTQQKATADCPGSSVEESLPFSPLHAPADKSFAESGRRQRGCVQDSGGAPRPGAVDPDGRQKPSNANPPAQHKRRSADKMLRLGSNGTKAHQTPVLGLQRKQRQLPAAFTPSAAPQPRATGTESYIAEKSDRIDSLRALYAGGFSKRRTGFQGMAMAPGSPSSWQSQDGGMHGNRPGGKETDTGEQPLSLPVGLPLGHKRQKGSSLDKDNSEKAERMLDMAPADITLTKIRDTNFTRLLPLKETRQ
uniref:Uncharacterized protein n=1 Tax=Toxoplasma gondii (strain ATCC 50861 / VEG) TaxID=432359 RepID=A0A0F7UVE4_TOXGV|nr:TPA: hypothetical protein BN1205_032645 [Toxoplasma gondii VEG]